jgi:hypothetical protein
LPPVEVDELLEREGVSDEVSGSVFESLPVLWGDRLPDVCREAGMSPGEEFADELLGDGMALEEAGEQLLAEQMHQQRGVRFRQREEATVRGEAAVGSERMEVRMPLQEISSGGDGDDETGADVSSRRAADEFHARLCASPGQLGQQIAPAAKQRPQQPRDGEHNVTMGHGSEQLLAQPFGPQELFLLLAGGAEAAAPAGEGNQHAPSTLGAP